MKVNLAYGQGHLPIELPDDRTTVIVPSSAPALSDERAAVLAALERPIVASPLRDWLKPACRVCIVFSDITRATPNDRIIPWLLEQLSGVPRENITLLNGLGTHRPNTPDELARLLGSEVMRDYKVLNHEPENPEALISLGTTSDGTPALINRHFVNADVRIVTGFIEPHFFAGFSGGPKGIMPGIAGTRTVISNHGPTLLGHPNATFGITRGNPLWEEMRDIALRTGPSFLLNVTLDEQRRITGVFAGDLLEAHRVGCEFVRASAMQRFTEPFDVVVTSNSGYPLDQNLYQGVKGMSAGARLLRPGGALILACECSEGVPANSSYDQILQSASTPKEILELFAKSNHARHEQWQVQIQAQIQQTAQIFLYSSLPDATARRAHLTPCHDITATVRELSSNGNGGARIAVLPQGPLTIPYLA